VTSSAGASLGSVALGGARWQGVAQAIEVSCGLGVLIYLARIVDAETFGVVSLAVAVAAVVSVVVATPVANAVVAHGLTEDRALSTVWWAACAPSAVVSIVLIGVFVLAGLGGREIVAVSVVMCGIPFLAWSVLVQAIQQQRLEFRAAAVARTVAALSAAAIAVALGLSGHGFPALLSRSVAPPILIAGVGMWQARWRPRFVLDAGTLREAGSYARGVGGFGLLNQLNRYADNLLIGFALGSAALGYYALAYRFIEMPVGQVGNAAQSVVFPTLARVGDEAEFREGLLRSQKLLVWIAAPFGVCAIGLGDRVVRLVLGSQWDAAGTIVQVFGAVALLQIAGTQVGVIYLARRATDLLARWAMLSTPVVVASFALGLLGGARGVAWAYLAANVVLFYPSWQFPGRLIGLTAGIVIRNLTLELGLAFGLAAVALLVRQEIAIGSLGALCVWGAVLSVAYWSIAAILEPRTRRDALQLLGMRSVAATAAR
jgi:O-antigen/teichoic acid export membrane protein